MLLFGVITIVFAVLLCVRRRVIWEIRFVDSVLAFVFEAVRCLYIGFAVRGERNLDVVNDFVDTESLAVAVPLHYSLIG